MQGMVLNEEEMASPYMQSVLGEDPLGIVFASPRNPIKLGERCRARVHLPSEESSEEVDEENAESDGEEPQKAPPRRKKGKKQREPKSKRPRQESSTSTGSSGGHSESDLFNKNEMRFMKKTAKLAYKEIKRRLLPKFKKTVVEIFEAMRCSTCSAAVHEPRCHKIPTPRRPFRQASSNDEDDDEDGDQDGRGGRDDDLHDTFVHVTPTSMTSIPATTMPTSSRFSFLDVPIYGESSARHSVHDIGHTFIPTSDVDMPGRHSMQDFGYGMPSFGNLFDMVRINNARKQYLIFPVVFFLFSYCNFIFSCR